MGIVIASLTVVHYGRCLTISHPAPGSSLYWKCPQKMERGHLAVSVPEDYQVSLSVQPNNNRSLAGRYIDCTELSCNAKNK